MNPTRPLTRQISVYLDRFGALVSGILRLLFIGGGMASSLLFADAALGSPPVAPTHLTAKSGENGEVSLTWEAAPGACSYILCRSTTQNDANARQIAADITTTSYVVKPLSNDTTYYFRVKAVGGGGVSGFSLEVAATTLITKPPLQTGAYTLAPKNAPNLRLQRSGGSPHAVITLGLESPKLAQLWTLTSVGFANYRLSPLSAPAHALAGDTQSDGKEPRLRLTEHAVAESSQWTLTQAAGGFRLTPGRDNGVALAAAGATDGSAVSLARTDGSSAQVWNILPASPSAPDPGTAYVPAGYKLVFSDEFDGTTIDATKWETLAPYSQPHLNDEIECYQPEAVILQDGLCILRAEERSTTCGDKYPWRSGAITSRSTRTYGYYEARIKLPQGVGLWPAFWLTSSKRWPPEWDVLEIPNPVGTLYQYLHPVKGATLTWVDGVEGRDSMYTSGEGMPNPYSGFVIYGCETTTKGVKLWVNGKLTAHWEVSSDTSDPMWISFNLAVGGKWPGAPDATTPRPSDMVIDYVRVYQ